jgi:hypothetical protein
LDTSRGGRRRRIRGRLLVLQLLGQLMKTTELLIVGGFVVVVGYILYSQSQANATASASTNAANSALQNAQSYQQPLAQSAGDLAGLVDSLSSNFSSF